MSHILLATLGASSAAACATAWLHPATLACGIVLFLHLILSRCGGALKRGGSAATSAAAGCALTGGGGLCGTNGPVSPGGRHIGWAGTKVHCFGRVAGWLSSCSFEGALWVVLGGGIVGGPCCGGGGGMVKAGGGVAGWLSGCSFEHWQEEPWQVLQAGALWVVLGGGTVGCPCFGGGRTKMPDCHACPKAALVFW